MGEMYDTDVLIWSEQQAQLLRRLAAGERVNDLIDWQNVIEEVDSVGREHCMPSSRCCCRRWCTC